MSSAYRCLRLRAAAVLYALVGLAIQVFKDTPELVDLVFDVNLLRGAAQSVPDAPADTAYNADTRTVSTTALSVGATFLKAFRQGPGGAPEHIGTGEPDELTVSISSMYTFDSGESYDLWLVAHNSKGDSAPRPVVVYISP